MSLAAFKEGRGNSFKSAVRFANAYRKWAVVSSGISKSKKRETEEFYAGRDLGGMTSAEFHAAAPAFFQHCGHSSFQHMKLGLREYLQYLEENRTCRDFAEKQRILENVTRGALWDKDGNTILWEPLESLVPAPAEDSQVLPEEEESFDYFTSPYHLANVIDRCFQGRPDSLSVVLCLLYLGVDINTSMALPDDCFNEDCSILTCGNAKIAVPPVFAEIIQKYRKDPSERSPDGKRDSVKYMESEFFLKRTFRGEVGLKPGSRTPSYVAKPMGRNFYYARLAAMNTTLSTPERTYQFTSMSVKYSGFCWDVYTGIRKTGGKKEPIDMIWEMVDADPVSPLKYAVIYRKWMEYREAHPQDVFEEENLL